MPVDSIEDIKRRMIVNASRMWGYRDTQDVNLFDPALALIFGAIAGELHRLSGQIQESDTRVIEKIVDLLFDKDNFPRIAAHAVATARPILPRTIIDGLCHFYFAKEINAINDKTPTRQNICFTPSGSTTLYNGEVRFILSGKYLYQVDGLHKEIRSESVKVPVDHPKIAIGLKMDSQIDSLEGITLFFSFKDQVTEDRFYQALHGAKWKLNGREVEFRKGFGNRQDHSQFQERFHKARNVAAKACRYINDYYTKKFITMDGGAGMEPMIKEIVEPEEAKAHSGRNIDLREILWIEADLRQDLTAEIMNDMYVAINCFPVINRELIELIYPVIKGINIIPLKTGNYLLDVESITDSENQDYISMEFSDGHTPEESTFMLRKGGVARFDSRNAKELIQRLIDLVRDEAAAFSAEGVDLISTELKQLDQIVSRLQQKFNISSGPNDPGSYVILKSRHEYSRIHVKYWTSAGDMANNIRQGSKLKLVKGIDLDEKSIALVTSTSGGKSNLTAEEKLTTLKRGLLSRGKIVTVEDIKLLCLELFGSALREVSIVKGVALMHDPEKGFERTLDIRLTLNEGAEEMSQKCEELKFRLEKDSMNLLPFRIFIQ